MAGAWMGGSQWGRPVAYGVVAGTLGDSKTAYPAQQHGSTAAEYQNLHVSMRCQ
jgi:hypothetical protein